MKTTTILVLSVIGVIGLVVLSNSYYTSQQSMAAGQAENEGYLLTTSNQGNITLLKAAQQSAGGAAASSGASGGSGIAGILGAVLALI